MRVQKRDIDNVCMHFDIKASNPCVLLTQEHAKKFLHHGNEEDRYQFFLQAANIDVRKADLALAKQNISLLEERCISFRSPHHLASHPTDPRHTLSPSYVPLHRRQLPVGFACT